jgi:hypothetical protein
MGGSQSKVQASPEPAIDLSKLATVPLNVAQDFENQAQLAANQAAAAAAELQRQNTWLSSLLFYGGILAVLIILGLVFYYLLWPLIRDKIWPPSGSPSGSSPGPLSSQKVGVTKTVPIKSVWLPGGLKDAQITQTILSADAPTTSSYGYQFWMYIKDWNYKFGEEKNIFTRSDASGSIGNPTVSLHPSDNIMKISVSVYPNENTSKNEPAPVNNSAATDDVFICEIPNVPIQQWVAVAITVDTKNLDVYFNGNLVKSCLLSGVPKPVLGDIIVNDNGGYSGWLCSFSSYSKTLIPSDAQAFTLGGAPCSIPDADNSYTGQFGFFKGGKEVTKYVF